MPPLRRGADGKSGMASAGGSDLNVCDLDVTEYAAQRNFPTASTSLPCRSRHPLDDPLEWGVDAARVLLKTQRVGVLQTGRIMKAIVLVTAILMASAHAAALDMSAITVKDITIRDSEFDSSVHYAGPELLVPVPASNVIVSGIQLHKEKSTGALSWLVVLGANYSAPWRYYDSVSLSGGKLISASRVDRNVGSCSYGSCDLSESVWIKLAPADARVGLAKGLKIRWNSRSGDGTFDIEISQAYFAALAEAAKR